MKKLITALFLTSAAVLGFGQNIALVHNGINVNSDTVDQFVTVNTPNITTDISVANLSLTYSDSIKVRRTIYTMETNDSTQFCWAGFCYPSARAVSNFYTIIVPRDTIDYAHPPIDGSPNDAFHVIFNTGPSSATRYVLYRFYNINNADDYAEVTIRYTTTVGINEAIKTPNTISNAYPNPASSLVSIKYDINDFSQKGRIIFYDVLGKSVKEVALNDKQGTATINISDLNTGIYFYKFIVDDKAIATKKIVISSK